MCHHTARLCRAQALARMHQPESIVMQYCITVACRAYTHNIHMNMPRRRVYCSPCRGSCSFRHWMARKAASSRCVAATALCHAVFHAACLRRSCCSSSVVLRCGGRSRLRRGCSGAFALWSLQDTHPPLPPDLPAAQVHGAKTLSCLPALPLEQLFEHPPQHCPGRCWQASSKDGRASTCIQAFTGSKVELLTAGGPRPGGVPLQTSRVAPALAHTVSTQPPVPLPCYAQAGPPSPPLHPTPTPSRLTGWVDASIDAPHLTIEIVNIADVGLAYFHLLPRCGSTTY